MQTFLHGRDLIGDLDFSKEEVETVLDVAFDLKRKRALKELTPYLRDRVLAMCSSSAARARAAHLKRAWPTWAGMLHLLTARPPRFPTAIPPRKLAKFSDVILTAWPSATWIGASATVI